MITSVWYGPGEDAALAYEIRKAVFQDELGFLPEVDVDRMDPYTVRLVLKLNDLPVATGRISYLRAGVAKIDRVAVVKKYRRQGIGDGLVKVLDYKASQMGMKLSQVETIPELKCFYERIGYQATGETVMKHNRNLIIMEKETNDGTRENCAHQCACP